MLYMGYTRIVSKDLHRHKRGINIGGVDRVQSLLVPLGGAYNKKASIKRTQKENSKIATTYIAIKTSLPI